MDARFAVAAVVAILGAPASGQARASAGWPEYPEPRLKQGREVWMHTCRDCHANPLSDAPQVKDRAAWAPRAAQPRAALHDHALKGFVGKAGEMPPRGGNASLSDDQVRAAVDYMIRLVTRWNEGRTK